MRVSEVRVVAVDVPCSHCGREPSHPQVRHRFIYAAYYLSDISYRPAPRSYIEALCEPCHEADRGGRVGTARNRFLARVRRWSAQPVNRGRIVRLIEHPESITGDEREGDSCFREGEVASYSGLVAAGRG